MIGALASHARKAVVAWFRCEGDRDPIIQGIRSREAWARFQGAVEAQREAARVKHAPVEPINQRQQQIVLAALRSAARRREIA